jgi:hypothetical protein
MNDVQTDTQQDQSQTSEQQQPVPQPAEDLSGVKLDMSKSTSIAQPQADTSDIKLDLSKSTPVADTNPLRGAAQVTSMGARPNDFHSWLQDVQADVKNGTDSTWVGSMLKKFGAKGTNYGVSEPISDLMAGPVLGVPKALEGGIEVKEAAEEGNLKKGVVGANKVIGGAFQSLGAAGMLLAPEGEALAVVTPAMVAQHVAQKTALHMGADEDTAELVGNVAAVVSGHQVHASLHPVIERFGVAVNNRTAAETEYVNRSRNLETARAQAAEVHQRAIDAAGNETSGAGTPEQTDQARQLANEAAKNVGDAQKAFDQASERRADATVKLEKLHRQITSVAEKAKAAEYERTASESQKASDYFQKAVPSKGANKYSPEDQEIARAHMEQAKAGGAKIVDLPSAYEAVEGGRQGIEDKLKPYLEKYADEPLSQDTADSPKVRVAQKLDEMAKVDGNFDSGMDALKEFNVTDPTVGEAQEMLTKLNNYQRAAMKGANNWDVYNMIETKPDFAARYFMAEELRDGLYKRLEGHGVEGAREARGETASLIRVRDAIGAQIRANRGGAAVRGSGSQSVMRNLVAKIVRKTGATAGAAIGAEAAGVHGAVAGAALGEGAASPLADIIAPRDMTRDEHIEKSMKYKGTNRKPVEIKGEGTSPEIPTEPTPPAPKTSPEPIQLTPRENTDLHAELAAHFGVTDLDSISYEDMERDLRKDIDVKKANGQPADPKEQALLGKVLKADTADRAVRLAAGKAASEAAILKPMKTPEEASKILQQEIEDKKNGVEKTDVNPALHALGRGDESGLVSHTIARKANVPASEISGLGEGVTSNDAHIHELAHLAMDAVDGEPTGIEIRSDKHPTVGKDTGAAAVFSTASIVDKNGIIKPEKLKVELDKRVTQKMAGPASHEVFGGMTKEDAMSHSATRSDVRTARLAVQTAEPDWSRIQVDEYLDGAYETARNFLTQPHIADRIKANAAVREEGLPDTLHVSRERVSKFQRDILEAHNDYTGTANSGSDSGGAGEGGEKNARPAGEGKEEKNTGGSEGRRGQVVPRGDGENQAADRVEKSQVGKVPPERTTGKPEVDAAIKEGGGIPGGVQKGFEYKDKTGEIKQYPDTAYVHEPTTGTSLNFPFDQITPEFVKQRLAEKRAEFAAAEKPKLEESQVEKSPATEQQLATHEKEGGSTFLPNNSYNGAENLAGKDLYSVGAYPGRTLEVDKLTPEVLEKFKTDNADLLSKGEHAVGTWKDPDTGKAVLDIVKTYGDRNEAIAAGEAANQKGIYHLGGEGYIPTGGTPRPAGGIHALDLLNRLKKK